MSLSAELAAKRDVLLALIQSYGRCAVAFSGGVDSCVVAKAAQLAIGDRAQAVTGVSESLAEGELEQASRVAQLIGIRHQALTTGEVSQPDYAKNDANRCYHCKTELYDQIARIPEVAGARILNGANVDDLGDYRPGMQAAAEHNVCSPLAQCGFSKSDVRQLARHWDLPTWDKPASPCLASRVAYGQEVTPARLQMIDQAEQYLRGLGLRTVRVRYHAGDLARLEVPVEDLARLAEPQQGRLIAQKLKGLGFKYVTLDLEGFRSGSQNYVLPVEVLLKTAPLSVSSPAAESGR